MADTDRNADTESVASAYIEAVGAHELDALDHLFADRLVAVMGAASYDRQAWLAALNRLLPALVRNDIREIFTDGERACVIYDFVTDTDAGAVRCVELVTVVDGVITEIELIFDRVAFAPVNQALSQQGAGS